MFHACQLHVAHIDGLRGRHGLLLHSLFSKACFLTSLELTAGPLDEVLEVPVDLLELVHLPYGRGGHLQGRGEVQSKYGNQQWLRGRSS